MNYNKKTVLDVDVSGKKVLLRCDFNVPQDKETGEITSDKRIVAALPTIRYLLDHGAAVIACSHLGKPEAKFDKWVKKQTEKGKDPATLTEEKWKKSLDKLTLAPVAKRLSELLGKDVIFAHDVVGEDAKAKAAALKGGEIMLLENTRFEAGETKNDPELAKALASMAELYVSDAFGTVHRAHASTAGVAAYLPAVSGLLVAKELEVMGKALDDPKRPFVAVLGGAKVSDKIAVINNLLEKVVFHKGVFSAVFLLKNLIFNVLFKLVKGIKLADVLGKFIVNFGILLGFDLVKLNLKYSLFACKILCLIFLGEGYVNVKFFVDFVSDDLIFKAGDKCARAEGQFVVFALSAFKGLAVCKTFKVNNGNVSVLGLSVGDGDYTGVFLFKSVDLAGNLILGNRYDGALDLKALIFSEFDLRLGGNLDLEIGSVFIKRNKLEIHLLVGKLKT